jgi:hypothetical protein
VILIGTDTDGNGRIDEFEAETSFVRCDGASGSLVETTSVPPGEACTGGGIRIDQGLDDNGDGVLQAAEFGSSTVVCSGRPTVVAVTTEPAGAQCEVGGERIDFGVDQDGDGALEPEEVIDSVYACRAVPAVPFAILDLPPGPTPVANALYRVEVEARGGTAGDYQWRIVDGALPDGLELSPVGTPMSFIAGIPNEWGTFTFTIEVSDFFDQSTRRTFELEVAPGLLGVDTHVVPRLDPTVPYDVRMQARGGVPPYTWALIGGRFPAGVEIDGSGRIFGTPLRDPPLATTVLLQVEDARGETAAAPLRFRNVLRFYAAAGHFRSARSVELFLSDLSDVEPGLGVALNPPPVLDGSLGAPPFNPAEDNYDVRFAPTADRVAFVGDFVTVGVAELFLVDLSLGEPGLPRRANPPGVVVDDDTYAWSPDGRWLAFVANTTPDAPSTFDLFVLDSSDSQAAAIRINRSGRERDVDTARDVRFSPDGRRLAYIADEVVNGRRDLMVADLLAGPGTAPSSVASPGIGNGDVTGFAWSPGSQFIVYRADVLAPGAWELFIADLNRPVPEQPVRLSAPLLDPQTSVRQRGVANESGDFGFSPDGRWVHYIVGTTVFVVDANEPGSARALVQAQSEVESVVWTLDSLSLVVWADVQTEGELELYIVDVTGRLPFGVLQRSGPARAPFIDPRGRGVFYIEDDALVFAPLDFRRAPEPLSELAEPTGFTMAQDGSVLAYVRGSLGNPGVRGELVVVDTRGDGFGPRSIVAPPPHRTGRVGARAGLDYTVLGDGEGIVYIDRGPSDEVVFTRLDDAKQPGPSTPLIPNPTGDAFVVYPQP